MPDGPSTRCPSCGCTAFVLCGGGCALAHPHTCTCLRCGQTWWTTTRVHPQTCRACGASNWRTEDDPNPGMCPACYGQQLEGLTELLLHTVALWGPDTAREWLRLKLIEDAGVPEDWADVLANRVAAGTGLLPPT